MSDCVDDGSKLSLELANPSQPATGVSIIYKGGNTCPGTSSDVEALSNEVCSVKGKKDGNNYCLPCYENQFALQCVSCMKVTAPQYNTIQYSHLADAFIQSDVQKLLVDGKKRDSMSLDLRPVSGTL